MNSKLRCVLAILVVFAFVAGLAVTAEANQRLMEMGGVVQ